MYKTAKALEPQQAKKNKSASSSTKASNTSSQPENNSIHGVYCEVRFGNRTVRTSVAQPNQSPTWNATVTVEVDPSAIDPLGGKHPSCSRCYVVLAINVRSSALMGSLQSEMPVGYLRVPLTAHQPASWTPIIVPVRATGHVYLQVVRVSIPEGAQGHEEQLTIDHPAPRLVKQFPVEAFEDLYRPNVRLAGSAITLLGPLLDERYLSRRQGVALVSQSDQESKNMPPRIGNLLVTNLRVFFVPRSDPQAIYSSCMDTNDTCDVLTICLWNIKQIRTFIKGFNVMLVIMQRDGHERLFCMQQHTNDASPKKVSLLDSRGSHQSSIVSDDWSIAAQDIMIFKNDPRTFNGSASLWCTWLQHEVFFRNAERHYPVFFANSVFFRTSAKTPRLPTHTRMSATKRSRRRLLRDIKRIRIPGAFWRATSVNEEFQCCDTYPQDLIVPRQFDDAFLLRAAAQRSKNRFAALSWVHTFTGAPLCRCSQPLMGMASREMKDDETMLHGILRATAAHGRRWNVKAPSRQQSASRLILVDARPQVTAFANAAAGRGYESLDFLNHAKWGVEGSGKVELHFMNVENIHAMRGSYEAVITAAGNAHDGNQKFDFGGALASSGWLQHLGMILRTSCFVASQLHVGNAVVVHCSDGWDRTAQITSLVQLFCDAYYRSIPGFLVLIEREWCAFGFQFALRGGAGTPASEAAPIFLQFLDCVYQLTEQFPKHFEFSSYFLVTIADAFYSGCFFNNLGNCARERSTQEEVSLRSRGGRGGASELEGAMPDDGSGTLPHPYVDASSFLTAAAYRSGNEALRNAAFKPSILEDKHNTAPPLLPYTGVGSLKLWETWFFRGSVIEWQRHRLRLADFHLSESRRRVRAEKALAELNSGKGLSTSYSDRERVRAAVTLQRWFWKGPSLMQQTREENGISSKSQEMTTISSTSLNTTSSLLPITTEFEGIHHDNLSETVEKTPTHASGGTKRDPFGSFFSKFGSGFANASTEIASATADAVSEAVSVMTVRSKSNSTTIESNRSASGNDDFG